MPVIPEYIDDGRYIIEDYEYGYRYCIIEFTGNVTRNLSHKELMEIMGDFISKLLTKLEDKEQNG